MYSPLVIRAAQALSAETEQRVGCGAVAALERRPARFYCLVVDVEDAWRGHGCGKNMGCVGIPAR